MTNPWFRMHSELLNDEKVQALPAETFRVWVNLLCVTNDSVSSTFHRVSCPFKLRISETEFETHFETLHSCGLIIEVGDEYQPKGWNKRQYKSDNSTERVRKHREKKKKCNITETVTPAVTVTPPDTDTDTEQKPPIIPLKGESLNGSKRVGESRRRRDQPSGLEIAERMDRREAERKESGNE